MRVRDMIGSGNSTELAGVAPISSTWRGPSFWRCIAHKRPATFPCLRQRKLTGPFRKSRMAGVSLSPYATSALPASIFLVTAMKTSKATNETKPTPMYAYHR